MNITVDEMVLILINIVLFLLLLISMFKDIYIKYKDKKDGIAGTIKMTDASVEFLNKFYLTVSIIVAFAIQVAEVNSLKGYKSLFMVLDYSVITYLAFFNSWFRNSIIHGKILPKVRKVFD